MQSDLLDTNPAGFALRPGFFLAAIPERSHPFPSRTRKLSSPGPMVLQGQPCGRVGRCRGFEGSLARVGLLLFSAHVISSSLEGRNSRHSRRHLSLVSRLSQTSRWSCRRSERSEADVRSRDGFGSSRTSRNRSRRHAHSGTDAVLCRGLEQARRQGAHGDRAPKRSLSSVAFPESREMTGRSAGQSIATRSRSPVGVVTEPGTRSGRREISRCSRRLRSRPNTDLYGLRGWTT
jgi:hypothetical protein